MGKSWLGKAESKAGVFGRVAKGNNYSKELEHKDIFRSVKRYVHVSSSVYMVGRELE